MNELEKYFSEKRVPLSPLKRGSYEFRNFLFFFELGLQLSENQMITELF